MTKKVAEFFRSQIGKQKRHILNDLPHAITKKGDAILSTVLEDNNVVFLSRIRMIPQPAWADEFSLVAFPGTDPTKVGYTTNIIPFPPVHNSNEEQFLFMDEVIDRPNWEAIARAQLELLNNPDVLNINRFRKPKFFLKDTSMDLSELEFKRLLSDLKQED